VNTSPKTHERTSIYNSSTGTRGVAEHARVVGDLGGGIASTLARVFRTALEHAEGALRGLEVTGAALLVVHAAHTGDIGHAIGAEGHVVGHHGARGRRQRVIGCEKLGRN